MDIALDDQGKVYFSTEFHGAVYVHDARLLKRQSTIRCCPRTGESGA